MIIVWQSLENRRKRRTAKAIARDNGLDLNVDRIARGDVLAHAVALSNYLVQGHYRPNPGRDPTKLMLRPDPAAPEDFRLAVARYSRDPTFFVDVANAKTGISPIPVPGEHPSYRLRALVRARARNNPKLARAMEAIIAREEPGLLAQTTKHPRFKGGTRRHHRRGRDSGR